MVERKMVNKRRCGAKSSRRDNVGRRQDSPEGTVVVLEERWLDVGEEKVWLTGEGKELVVGLLGRLGGNESVSVTSSSNGSG